MNAIIWNPTEMSPEAKSAWVTAKQWETCWWPDSWMIVMADDYALAEFGMN